ncbi:BRISC and BRCA1-A complex member 2-like [Ornithodoros turicata]|uniref:BRISC and BRCA1-A complex member 2-like n=1 Tax=Ornithodoros turicata TaxID=34597 RepID=UPI003139C102
MDQSYAPHVRVFLQNLLDHSIENIRTTHPIRLISADHGGPRDGSKQLLDRFKISVPYGGQTLMWEVIFQAHRADWPPDFIFDDVLFLPDIAEIPSLLNWNHSDEKALIPVLNELLDLYRKFQVTTLESYPRAQFEYTSLVLQTDITESAVEVYINKKNANGPIRFWIRLPIDFSKLPPVFAKENLSEDSAILQVTFQTPDGNRVIPQLFLSPRVQEGIGGTLSMRIPALNKDCCLMDYVPVVKQLIENKVEQVSSSFAKRKEYISALLGLFGGSLIEFDAENFTSISFLFEHKDFFFLLSISLPRFFPQDKPSLTFQSIYHTSMGWPYSITCTDYPYSPRWTPQEMANRARTFIVDYVQTFQRSSLKNR